MLESILLLLNLLDLCPHPVEPSSRLFTEQPLTNIGRPDKPMTIIVQQNSLYAINRFGICIQRPEHAHRKIPHRLFIRLPPQLDRLARLLACNVADLVVAERAIPAKLVLREVVCFALIEHFSADFAQISECDEGKRDIRVPVGGVNGLLLG